MTGNGRPEQAGHGGGVADTRPACVALVPMAQPTEWTETRPLRPASTFIAQLLATAEHAPPTRKLRRDTAADALTAYSANPRAHVAGIRTRQII